MTDLPPSWQWAKVSDLGDVVTGATPKTSKETNWGGHIPFVTPADMVHLGVTRTAVRSVTEAGSVEGRPLPDSSVLVTCIGILGRTTLSCGTMLTNQQINAIVPHPGLSSRYLELACASPNFQSQLERIATSTTVALVNKSNFGTLQIPVAPDAEQGRIVAAVDEQLSRLDAGVAALERSRQELRRLRAAILREAVATAQKEGAEPVALGDIVVAGRKMAYGVLVPGDDVSGGVPFVRVGDLVHRSVSTGSLKRIDPSVAARYPRTRLEGGEVLLSLVGTIGRTAVVPPELVGANAARALAVIPPRADVEPKYVAIALDRSSVTQELSNLAHEVARKTLNLEDVRKYEIPLPTHAEQLAVVEKVEHAEAWISTVEGLIDNAMRRSELLRSSVLASALSGKLGTQDETDTPAWELLERIKSERERSRPSRSRRKEQHRVGAKSE